MVINFIIRNQQLCDAIENEELENIISILGELDKFEYECILPQRELDKLFELLHKHRKNDNCNLLSRCIDKMNRRGRKIIFDDVRYDREQQIIDGLCANEAQEMKEIFYNGAKFTFTVYKICYSQGQALRQISSLEDFRKVMTLFGNSIDIIEEFVEYIKKVFDNIIFDKDVKKSMDKLVAGYLVRRNEILYHLYCINQEIPAIIKKYGMLDNQSMGEKMSIPCSPERSRNTVENKLTKIADNGDIKCELHTKMKKIGSHKPDRIYFCASVPKGIVIDGENMSGKLFVYKITSHA